MDAYDAVARYVADFHLAFELSYDESADKISDLHRAMVDLTEEQINRQI